MRGELGQRRLGQAAIGGDLAAIDVETGGISPPPSSVST
jgi:hypothetical protein